MLAPGIHQPFKKPWSLKHYIHNLLSFSGTGKGVGFDPTYSSPFRFFWCLKSSQSTNLNGKEKSSSTHCSTLTVVIIPHKQSASYSKKPMYKTLVFKNLSG